MHLPSFGMFLRYSLSLSFQESDEKSEARSFPYNLNNRYFENYFHDIQRDETNYVSSSSTFFVSIIVYKIRLYRPILIR